MSGTLASPMGGVVPVRARRGRGRQDAFTSDPRIRRQTPRRSGTATLRRPAHGRGDGVRHLLRPRRAREQEVGQVPALHVRLQSLDDLVLADDVVQRPGSVLLEPDLLHLRHFPAERDGIPGRGYKSLREGGEPDASVPAANSRTAARRHRPRCGDAGPGPLSRVGHDPASGRPYRLRSARTLQAGTGAIHPAPERPLTGTGRRASRRRSRGGRPSGPC